MLSETRPGPKDTTTLTAEAARLATLTRRAAAEPAPPFPKQPV
jgi:hypothetical protein